MSLSKVSLHSLYNLGQFSCGIRRHRLLHTSLNTIRRPTLVFTAGSHSDPPLILKLSLFKRKNLSTPIIFLHFTTIIVGANMNWATHPGCTLWGAFTCHPKHVMPHSKVYPKCNSSKFLSDDYQKSDFLFYFKIVCKIDLVAVFKTA